MNIPPTIQPTRYREQLQAWHDRQAAAEAYRHSKDIDQGSPLPAILLLAVFCAGVMLGIWWTV